MGNTEFNNVEHGKLLGEGYKFIEIIATGKDVETSEDYFRKEVILVAHKSKPKTSQHYVVEIMDDEIKEIARGNDTDIFYLQIV